MTDLTAPVDDLNAACAQARVEIRERFAAAQRRADYRAVALVARLERRLHP